MRVDLFSRLAAVAETLLLGSYGAAGIAVDDETEEVRIECEPAADEDVDEMARLVACLRAPRPR